MNKRIVPHRIDEHAKASASSARGRIGARSRLLWEELHDHLNLVRGQHCTRIEFARRVGGAALQRATSSKLPPPIGAAAASVD